MAGVASAGVGEVSGGVTGSATDAGAPTAGLGSGVLVSSGGIPRFYSTAEPCLGRLTQRGELIATSAYRRRFDRWCRSGSACFPFLARPNTAQRSR